MNSPDFIHNIPLDKLVKSPRNVRKTPASETAEVELRASIAAHGIQQNLIVAPANGDGVHEVSLPPSEGFARLCALSAGAKQALFAWCVAQTLQGQLAFEDKADPAIEQVGARLGIDFAAHWRPTADNYWGRVKKSHALEVGAAVLGTHWQHDHAKDKKPELAKALEAAFAGDGTTTLGLDPETCARAGAWVPPGMAYGGSPDESPPAPAGSVDEADRIDGEPGSDTPAGTIPAFLTADSPPGDAEACQASARAAD